MRGKKLTDKEREDRAIQRIFDRIMSIQMDYGKDLTRKACRRWAEQEREEIKLQREIAEKEKELKNLKRKVGQ